MSVLSIRKSISLYRADWAYVEAYQNQFSMGRSAAIRFLINDQKRLKETYEPANGRQTKQEG